MENHLQPEGYPTTLGQLIDSGYQPLSVKEELRKNLIFRIKNKIPVFEGIYGYDDTVLPEVERAILSGHHFILLGLRGQAKTRIARLLINLLDEYVPVVYGSELNDDPLAPLSRYAKDMIAERGKDTPVAWLHRTERYTEKLATPDVSVSDLIGDADPIKAANLRLPYSDERVIHFGLIPRSHRGLFVINELPDLQPRIQVALFNILQEGDIQIRGFKLRLPLDVQFVFTANPEDYTNRGSIITPLKDRIDSQIITHYPADIAIASKITAQEAKVQHKQHIHLPALATEIIEQVAFEARDNEYVDPKSGVSARLTISALENLYSSAERRLLTTDEAHGGIRVADFWATIPSITGKVELVYEGEQEGSLIVAQNLIGKSIRRLFGKYLPDPDRLKKKMKAKNAPNVENPYQIVQNWFGNGGKVDISGAEPEEEYKQSLSKVEGLNALVDKYFPTAKPKDHAFLMEFILHGMAEHSLIGRKKLAEVLQFNDLLEGMLNFGPNDLDED